MLIVEDAIEQLKRIENMNQHYQKAAENNEFVRKYIENSTILSLSYTQIINLIVYFVL